MISLVSRLAAVLALSLPLAAGAADAQRQADVAARGAAVMPFDLHATTHFFTTTGIGGVQRVVARHPDDPVQVGLVRQHLQEIESRFRKGDFSGPEHIHGADMPGLAELRAAPPGEISISYREVRGGAELAYRTADPQLVRALHAWFAAQRSDHGTDAVDGHRGHPGHSGK